MAALYELSRSLSQSSTLTQITEAALDNIENIFGCDCVILLTNEPEFNEETPRIGSFEVDSRDLAVASWVLRNQKPAGNSTDTLSSSKGYFEPLMTPNGVVGVVGLRPEAAIILEQKTLLQTMAGLVAISVELVNFSEEAKKALISAQSEKLYTILLHSLSHELRTPLTSITGAVSSLIDTDVVNNLESRGILLQEIRESAAILNRLIGNLLDMSRFEGGHVKLRLAEYDLDDAIHSALDRLDPDKREHKFVNEVPPGKFIVVADITLLEQVFHNLFLNAILYTPPGTMITISAHSKIGLLEVVVEDNGPGLHDPSLVFEKFYRGPVKNEAGTGLGLSVCKAIIEQHGGRISASNRPEGGARFTVELPRPGAS